MPQADMNEMGLQLISACRCTGAWLLLTVDRTGSAVCK